MAYNQTYMPPTDTAPLSPSDSALLEVLVPGYAMISRVLLSHLHIDITQYLQLFIQVGLVSISVRYVYYFLVDLFMEWFISTAEIRLDDEVYAYLMYYVSQQPHMKRTPRFVAGVKVNGYWSDGDDSDDEDDDAMDDEDEPGSGANADSFDDYWAKLVRRDKYRTLRFTPSQGNHYFWYKGQLVMLERRYREDTSKYVLNNERLYLSCLGRNPALLKTLLAEAQQAYVERDGNRTVIYRGQRHSRGNCFYWTRCMARSPRPLSTVVLDHEQKQSFVDDIKEYLHPRTRRWYSNRGIPYRRGYLLYGHPGTGKTSLCFAAAGLLNLKLYLLNLNSKSLDEDSLMSLFADLPRRCIVLLEDVDTAGITHSRGNPDASKDEKPLAEDPKSSEKKDKAASDEDKPTGITLSGLLNVIDGVAASEGRIVVMTTNHADKLDAALLRPGRVDMSIAFGFTSRADIEELFTSIYTTMEGDLPRAAGWRSLSNGSATNGSAMTGSVSTAKPQKNEIHEKEKQNGKDLQQCVQSLRTRINALASEFASVVPSDELTAAEIQGYLLNHKDSPEAAIAGAATWVQSMREKKQAREEKI